MRPFLSLASYSSGLIETHIRCCRNFGQHGNSLNLFVCVKEGSRLRLPVASARHGDFIQPEPRHENAWTSGKRRSRKGLHHAISRMNFTVGRFKLKQDQLQLNEWLKVNMFRKVRFSDVILYFKKSSLKIQSIFLSHVIYSVREHR